MLISQRNLPFIKVLSYFISSTFPLLSLQHEYPAASILLTQSWPTLVVFLAQGNYASGVEEFVSSGMCIWVSSWIGNRDCTWVSMTAKKSLWRKEDVILDCGSSCLNLLQVLPICFLFNLTSVSCHIELGLAKYGFQVKSDIVSALSGKLYFHSRKHEYPVYLHNPRYSCLQNPMDRGTWWAMVHGVAKSWTRQKQLSPQHTLVNIFSLPYNFLHYFLACFVVRIQSVIHITYKICGNGLFMLSIRLPVSSTYYY